MDSGNSKRISGCAKFHPAERLAPIMSRDVSLSIGILSDEKDFENRTPITPQGVEMLVKAGHRIIIESNAGKASGFLNSSYVAAGAIIAQAKEEVFKSQFIIKVAPFSQKEINSLNSSHTIISTVPLNCKYRNPILSLMDKRLTAICMDLIESEDGYNPYISTMGQIAGNLALTLATSCLTTVDGGKGIILGNVLGIPKTEVVILGTNKVAETIANIAISMGAQVCVYDSSLRNLEELQSKLGDVIQTSMYHHNALSKSLLSADIVINTNYWGSSQVLINEEMVKSMKAKSVIVDISNSQGRNIETSETRNTSDFVFEKHGVTHICISNICSLAPKTASIALSNIFTQSLLDIGKAGGIESYLRKNYQCRRGTYIFKGLSTNMRLSEELGLQYSDLELLFEIF
ncbi:MAG: NAD(P)-dependent oxidoreductase [Bacteroidales bacterium]